MIRNLTVFTFILLSNLSLTGKEFKVASGIDSVKNTGYHKIQLSCDIISFAKDNYGDIRLMNSKGEEIPYIFREEKPAISTTGFKEYKITENEYRVSQKLSRVVFVNPGKKVLSELVLIIRNSEIEKEITLKGSDNNKEWFIIWKGLPEKAGIYNETSGVFTINFPKSDYAYFEISTNDKKKDPVQITKVGYYDSSVVQGLYTEVPIKSISQKDSSNKKSYITVKFERPYEFSKIELTVSGPDFYQRNAYIGNFSQSNNKAFFDTYQGFDLSSAKAAVWETDKLKLDELVLVIENFDNKPLKINAIKFFQLNKYLIAKLNKGETYFVKAGDESLNHPEYDLKYFADSIPDSLAVLHTIETSIQEEAKSPVSKIFFTKTVLWVVISLVIVLLGFFSIRLIKEMK